MAGETSRYPSTDELRRKRIKYHIAKRANLEVETILKRFWEREGEKLDSEALEQLERLLELNDLDLLDVFYGRKELPATFSQNILKKIRSSIRGEL